MHYSVRITISAWKEMYQMEWVTGILTTTSCKNSLWLAKLQPIFNFNRTFSRGRNALPDHGGLLLQLFISWLICYYYCYYLIFICFRRIKSENIPKSQSETKRIKIKNAVLWLSPIQIAHSISFFVSVFIIWNMLPLSSNQMSLRQSVESLTEWSLLVSSTASYSSPITMTWAYCLSPIQNRYN